MRKYSLEAKDLLSEAELCEIKAGLDAVDPPTHCSLICATCVSCPSSCTTCMSSALDVLF